METNERKLATIAKIMEINPIEGADAIEVATIRGWKVVVKKNEFNVGDLCVYCEIDSVLPEREEFEFLRNKKFRIKTIKLRGQVSQGIAFPMEIIDESITWHGDHWSRVIDVFGEDYASTAIEYFEEGKDVTEELGITKYEAPIPACLAGKMKGSFPSHSIKTDEERVQNLMDEYEKLKEYTYYVTEKLDGSSMTCYLNDDEFGVTSRNLDLIETEDNTFWKVARELKIEEKMRAYAKANGLRNFNLQGELIGEGIQKNKYKLKGQTVKFFRSFNIDTFEFFDYELFVQMIADMELETVPVLGISKLPETVEDLLKYVEGKSMLNKNTEREGIVFVSTEFVKKFNGRLSLKGISNRFLLKNDE